MRHIACLKLVNWKIIYGIFKPLRHGLNTTAIAGNLIARAIVDDDDTYELFSPFRLNFVAKPLGLLGAELIYLSWKTRDLLDEYLG